jgi:DNA primase
MDAVEEVKSHLDIVDVAAEYLQLKPAGSGSFKANCPFHQEKTPSFYVNRQRQSWHCFGCDKGGDVISLVQGIEGMDFRDALAHLAMKAGVTLPAFNTQAAGERKRLQTINDLAARFFRSTLLQSPDAGHAREYAAKRGIDDLTGDLFRIGYAPNSWDALTNALKAKEVTDDELLRAGLTAPSQRGTGSYDRFRDRLIFAIHDVHGNIIGFTGRLLNPDAKEAKYVNTPETALFKKSAVLYGLDKAKGDIKSKDLCVLVEGNMDVLSSHRVGVANVVCPGGTALTADQLRLIARFTKNLAIAFDADAAGINATLRGLDLARAEDFSIRIISLPDGIKDPDEAIAKDPVIWTNAIRDAVDIMEWVFRLAFKGKDLSNPNDKREIARVVLPEVKRIADPIVRDHWVKKLAKALGTNEDALRDALKGVKSHGSGTRADGQRAAGSGQSEHPTAGQPINHSSGRARDLAERIVSIVLSKQAPRARIPENLPDLLSDDLRALYTGETEGYDCPRFSEVPRPADPFAAPEQTLDILMNMLAIRFDRDYPNQTADALASELEANISALAEIRKMEARSNLEAEMNAAEIIGDVEAISDLSRRFKELTS